MVIIFEKIFYVKYELSAESALQFLNYLQNLNLADTEVKQGIFQGKGDFLE